MNRISEIQWFNAAHSNKVDERVEASLRSLCKRLELPCERITLLDETRLSEFVSSYDLTRNVLWGYLKDIPERLEQEAIRKDAQALLSFPLNEMQATVFHSAFDGAFQRYAAHGEEVVRFAVVAAMFVSGLVVAWEIIKGSSEREQNPLLPLIMVFEAGYLPLGLFDGCFLVR
ncbi:hypothetical protein [Alicyclobacillus cycloheptanicus]|uniref:Uncharacterized protein n=1 Tax=Alicyclobacillus cycloheptanicus TaxID=1457 RepID=A0ABT9XJ02_9BACL|nr:hypothetical protein [Alicyclobacillus cycloheptanicus]MDQ0190260.1 hypothetical protein [Alicyclobacillus cycloheptanicus]